ncbi:hypothetical protein SAMN06264364_11648 [Quadrisphaera granulorum]|uniref:Uncharacterized protein n=1 Tax=Quadrisphaera granulorum TaxID=317664 RepID=A0A316A601_9ACTN|nr:hypothetical protein [Quadrisphaera granulorum]PWJ52912.1 hypothetical protein BXY45_11648 [Quadrisphaera granulorum]SZE97294.1 hypothetical protein SAMN06264364_11648 [Quadrisphaera granulorum]
MAQTSEGTPTPEEDLSVWKRLAPSGMLLVGTGLCVTLDASARRSSGSPLLRWVAEGTAGLVLVNAGLALYGEAMKRRGLYDAATRP